MKKIEEFLIDVCGYKSIEEAKRNYKPLNFYPLMGEIDINKSNKKR